MNAATALRRTVEIDWPKHAKDGARTHLIAVARAGHAKIMSDAARNGGMVPTFEAFAGAPGKPIEQVDPPREAIVYRYFYGRELLRVAMNELRRASPFFTGAYARAHTLFVNGVAVADIPKDIKAGAELFIANPVPYSRRLEIGKTKSGRDFVVSVPNRIYQRTAEKIAKRYVDVARVWFAYVDIAGAYKTKGKLPTHYAAKANYQGISKMRRRNQKPGSQIQAPALHIKFYV